MPELQFGCTASPDETSPTHSGAGKSQARSATAVMLMAAVIEKAMQISTTLLS